MNKPKVGVLLAGCGVYDGAEIHESVVTLLALDRAGAQAICLAPSVAQLHVIDHNAGTPTAESRDVLVEAARIARGQILSLDDPDIHLTLDALIIPGGFGAAKNLCTFAVAGADCTVNPQVEALIAAVHKAGKPIGAMCIAPVILAKTLGAEKPRLTIGSDAATAQAIETMGAIHVPCPVDGLVVDEAAGIVTTPAYMLASWIAEAATGIEKLVAEVLRLAAK
jgi:enhancing lycopene biosynthesis protein 2